MAALPRHLIENTASAAIGALAGWSITVAMMPYLRAIDPIGYTPILLIGVLGGVVLFRYIRRVLMRAAS
jgi:hypothetical protein